MIYCDCGFKLVATKSTQCPACNLDALKEKRRQKYAKAYNQFVMQCRAKNRALSYKGLPEEQIIDFASWQKMKMSLTQNKTAHKV